MGYVQGPLKWAIVAAASLGALLEVIDTSIVNVALNDMQASLSATVSEIGWVVSGYAIANVILIPLSAWLGERFGTKNYFIFSLIGFTISSVVCGLSVNLAMMIVARIVQGLCGGGLLAKAQAILFTTFPPAEQGMAQAVFGLGVIVGPAIGPTLGGFLVDGPGWRWIFFVNLPVGILATLISWFALPNDSDHPTNATSQTTKVDWWGIVFLIVAVGSLQTFLEEGQQDDWFDSSFITTLAIASVIGFVLFIGRELSIRHPAVDLRVLRHRSLAAGSIFSGILGLGLYGTTFVIPIFAQGVLQFTATQTGLLLAPSAMASAIAMLLMSRLTGKVDARLLIGIGAVGISFSMFQLANITPQSGEDDLFYPLIWRGVFTIFMYLPLNLAALSSLPKPEIAAGSGFFNLTRQLGGSIAIAALTTLLDDREAFHRALLLADLTPYNIETTQRLNTLASAVQSRGTDAVTAKQQALAILSQTVDLQASVLAYADLFRVVGVVFLCSLPLLLLLDKGDPSADVPMEH
ncbi:MAG: DHA2 family efflux MFS transporter permease subunit [Stenomitos rutilans HA7619-LM2]|jgi:DHA2 family multidrug resistance protein|nr:DHA2 family efflux MFS transporter permease subunit [Stenomitos rutilans HA7619-LM2]